MQALQLYLIIYMLHAVLSGQNHIENLEKEMKS